MFPVVTLAFLALSLGLAVYLLLGFGPVDPGPGGITTIEVPSRQHVYGSVDYAQEPPVGGPHAAVWQNCGFYSRPIITEQAVHSLEHGAVWITYRPNLARSQIDKLRVLAASDSHILASPWAGVLPAPIVASAWGRQIPLKSAADPALAEFVRLYRAGLQTPEPGAPCTGGIGVPE